MSLTDQYTEAQTDRESDETPKARKSAPLQEFGDIQTALLERARRFHFF